MRVAALWCVVCATLASCYQRGEFGSCAIACDPNNATSCPDGLTCVGGRCAAAGESCPVDGPSPDAPIPEGCIATTFLGVVCPPLQGPGNTPLAGNLDTTACTFLGASVYQNTCMVFGDEVSLEDVRATGDKPLVVISDSTMSISGDLDVGSYTTAGVGAGGNVGCALAGAPGEDGRDVVGETFGGGGGAGGSYQTTGGAGGIGEKSSGTNMAPGGSSGAVQTVGLRGGCRGGAGGATGQVNGGNGPAGDGGGAVYLVARTSIDLVGVRLLAGGSGGGAGGVVSGGGGGGGSGGAILLETPHIAAQGPVLICANGGGGGGGAEDNTTGQQAADACLIGVESAIGGIGGSANVGGGNGGEGSTALGPGEAGQPGDDGGGGGAGGGGYVVVIGAPSAEVQDFAISPPPLMGGG